MTEERIDQLFQGYTQHSLSATERSEWLAWAGLPENRARLEELLATATERELPDVTLPASKAATIFERITERPAAKAPVHSVHFLKTAWFRYAAAFIILLGVSASIWLTHSGSPLPLTAGGSKTMPADISPGGNKAILTLADGTSIVLDSARNGELAEEGSSHAIKKTNGQLVYDITKGPLPDLATIPMHTLSTPKGGMYQLVLPDGTGVWLNAASSITYPVVFTGSSRSVTISGEAFFEVAKNGKMPFTVKLNDQASVEVLGTQFNINAYTDESGSSTTLLEGSVRVNSYHQSEIIAPGQRAELARSGGIAIKSNVNTGAVMAWKNGLFDFEYNDLKTVMRQVQRWYNINVVYEKGVNTGEVFRGQMQRSLSLLQLIKLLKDMDLNIKLEGRTMTIMK